MFLKMVELWFESVLWTWTYLCTAVYVHRAYRPISLKFFSNNGWNNLRSNYVKYFKTCLNVVFVFHSFMGPTVSLNCILPLYCLEWNHLRCIQRRSLQSLQWMVYAAWYRKYGDACFLLIKSVLLRVPNWDSGDKTKNFWRATRTSMYYLLNVRGKMSTFH